MGIFDIFLKKQRQVERTIFEYLEQWRKCLKVFRKGMDVYLDEGLGAEFDFCVESTHKMESQADDLRRKIEWDMYSKALIPESRGDILGFLETTDKIPGKAESILFDIQMQKQKVPKELVPDFKRIISLSCEAMDLVYDASKMLFHHEGDILKLTDKIDQKESECDHAQRDIIRKIFNMDIDAAEKILLKELVLQIGRLTDRAEHVADRLTLLSVKRRV